MQIIVEIDELLLEAADQAEDALIYTLVLPPAGRKSRLITMQVSVAIRPPSSVTVNWNVSSAPSGPTSGDMKLV